MGGIVGRLFREFAVTLSVAILVSLVVSLTTTPMMCARLLRPPPSASRGRFAPRRRARVRRDRCAATSAALAWALRHGPLVMLVLLATDRASTSTCTSIIPKGFFPQQDTGRADRLHPGRPEHLVPGDAAEARRLHRDRARRSGGRERRRLHRRRAAQLGLDVRRAEAAARSASRRADQVIARLRGKLAHEPGANLFLHAGAGHPHRRPAGERAVPVHAAGRRSRRAARLGAADPRGAVATCRSSSTSTPTSRTRACRPRSSSTATRRRGSASRRA